MSTALIPADVLQELVAIANKIIQVQSNLDEANKQLKHWQETVVACETDHKEFMVQFAALTAGKVAMALSEAKEVVDMLAHSMPPALMTPLDATVKGPPVHPDPDTQCVKCEQANTPTCRFRPDPKNDRSCMNYELAEQDYTPSQPNDVVGHVKPASRPAMPPPPKETTPDKPKPQAYTAYKSKKVLLEPNTRAHTLLTWIKAHDGKFTRTGIADYFAQQSHGGHAANSTYARLAQLVARGHATEGKDKMIHFASWYGDDVGSDKPSVFTEAHKIKAKEPAPSTPPDPEESMAIKIIRYLKTHPGATLFEVAHGIKHEKRATYKRLEMMLQDKIISKRVLEGERGKPNAYEITDYSNEER